jgi:hypothetical protein
LQIYVELEQKLVPLVEESVKRLQTVFGAVDSDRDINDFIKVRQTQSIIKRTHRLFINRIFIQSADPCHQQATKSGMMPPARAQYHPYDEAAGRCMAPSSSIR